MTEPDSAPDDDNISLLNRDDFGAALNAKGYSDVLVLRREVGHEVLAEDRLEIIDYLRDQDELTTIDLLVQEFSRTDDGLRKDLNRLAELDVIEYDHTTGEPRPILKHAQIVVEPI